MSLKVRKIVSIVLAMSLILSSAVIFAQGRTAQANADKAVSQTDTLEQAMDLLSEENTAVTEASSETHGEWTRKTKCAGDACPYTPIIIVPGIMQSQVYITDEEGNDVMTVDGFPIVESMDMAFMFDTEAVKRNVKSMIWDLIKALLFGSREKFIDLIVDLMDDSLDSHYYDPDGTRKYGAAVDEYWYSIEEAKNHPDKSYNYAKGYGKNEDGTAKPTTKYPTEFDFILKQVDLSKYAKKAGYDHAYYYAYSSFGDTYEIAQKLNDYIAMVKAETGHSKVSVVFISLGGTIGNVYLSDFCNPADIDRVVFTAAAVDGSYVLSDLIGANLSFDNSELLYSDMIPELLEIVEKDYKWLGYLLNVVIRIIPQKFFSDFLMETMDRLINEVLNNLCANCPSMWALVPSSVYPSLSQKLISDEAHTLLKAKTDRYYQIQKNAANTVKRLAAEGMDIFVVCGYNLRLPMPFKNYSYSSDNIIQVQSASFGATAAPVGETLSASYKPAIDSSYISPENEIDAGTAALPDRTWFVRGQSHLALQTSINDVIELCVQIAVNKDITDSRVHNGGYKQFNSYRDLKLIEDMMWHYEKLDEATVGTAGTADQVAKLKGSYQKTLELYRSLDWNPEKAKAQEEELYTIMYNMKLLRTQDDAQSPFVKYKLMPFLEMFFHKVSNIVNKTMGPRDFVPFI